MYVASCASLIESLEVAIQCLENVYEITPEAEDDKVSF